MKPRKNTSSSAGSSPLPIFTSAPCAAKSALARMVRATAAKPARAPGAQPDQPIERATKESMVRVVMARSSGGFGGERWRGEGGGALLCERLGADVGHAAQLHA